MIYTIDLHHKPEGWRWRVYINGGMALVDEGMAETLEAASDEARRLMLVDYRKED